MYARALASVLVLLAGCATPEPFDYSAARNSWQGAPFEAVVAQWGAPARSTVLADGRDVHTWFSETGSGGALYPSFGIFGGSRGVGAGAGVMVGQGGGELLRCERTLYFRNGQVVEQSWLGNSRYCGTFGRNRPPDRGGHAPPAA
jgi:hypothetical protein